MIPCAVQQDPASVGLDWSANNAQGCDQVLRVLFLLVGLSDVTEDGDHERLDAGLVAAPRYTEVAVLTPVTAPAVGNHLEF